MGSSSSDGFNFSLPLFNQNEGSMQNGAVKLSSFGRG